MARATSLAFRAKFVAILADPTEMRDTNHKARRTAGAPVLVLEHRSEHTAPLGGCDAERLSPVDYGKLTQKASAASSSHHAEVCDALLNIRCGSTATTEARSRDHARSDSFAHSSAHHRSPDRGHSDLCFQHQHRRAGRFCAFRRVQRSSARHTRASPRSRAFQINCL